MRPLLIVLLSQLALAHYSTARAIEPDAPERLLTARDAVGMSVRRLLDTDFSARAQADDRAALAKFYANRADAPLWIDDHGLTPKAQAVMAEISKAADHGLDPRQFMLPTSPQSSSDAAAGPDDLAKAETMLSLAVLTYARHARGGRIPEPSKQLSSYLDRTPQLKDPADVLDEIATTSEPDAYLRELHPRHPQFKLLREALLKLRRGEPLEPGENNKKFVRMPAEGPILSPGKRHRDVALLRERLGISSEPGGEDLFDDAVGDAVKAFQREHGLGADGMVGRGTRQALNGGKTEEPVRESAILASLEAWRWMPEDLGEFHVTVNIPEFAIRVVKSGEVVHAERVIVGKTNNQTPVFSDVMRTVVFHPFWAVPDSIKVKEIQPSLYRTNGALHRHNLRLQYNGREVDASQIDWSQADIRRYHVYQPPGDSNVLGQVKFMFPNKHQTYMHDTPTKNLFNSQVRTFSHGCMRVRDPLKLAEAVLGHDRDWSRQMIDDTLASGPQNNEITLERKIPVHVTYFTAVAAEDGTVKTYADVYGHERRITLALAGRFNEIDRGRDHLAPVKLERPEYAGGQGYAPVGDLFQAIFGF